LSKVVFLRPFAIINSTNWSGATVAAIDPFFPINHDDGTSYATYEQPDLDDWLSASLTDKPNDIQSVTSVKVIYRDQAIDGKGTAVGAVNLLGSRTSGSGVQNEVSVWNTRTSAALDRPGGGEWSPADIAEVSLYAEVKVDTWDDSPSPSLFERITSLYIELTYEPIPAQDDGARDAASRAQWAFTRRPPMLQRELTVADGFRQDLNDRVRVSHGHGPHASGQGWRSRGWESEPHRIISRRTNLESNIVTLNQRSIRSQIALMRWSARGKTSSPLGDGVSFFAAGSALEFVRDGLAWVGDPSLGSIYVRADADQPRYGLGLDPATGDKVSGVVCEPVGFNSLAYSSFKDGLTGWTTSAGSGTITAATSPLRFASQESPNVLKIVAGSPHSTLSTVTSTVTGSYAANARTPFWFSYQTGAGATVGPSVVIQRSVDSFYYTVSGDSWGASRVANPTTASNGEWTEYYIPAFSVGSSITTLTVQYSVEASVVSSSEYYVGHGQLDGDDIHTSPIITESSGVGRVAADVYKITNDTGARCINEAHGTLVLRFAPNYTAADLTADSPDVLDVDHGASNSLTLLWSDTNTRWELTWKGGGTDYTAYNTGGTPARGEAVDFVLRWTGADDELDLGDRTLDLFVDGVIGTSVVIGTDITEAATSDLLFSGANGVISDVLSLPYVVTDAEAALLPIL